MASAVARAFNGGLGGAPSGVQGQRPWSGGQGAKPPEAESFFALGRPVKTVKFDVLTVSVAQCVYT